MKITTILTSLALVFSIAIAQKAQAQGFLKKLKEKAESASGSVSSGSGTNVTPSTSDIKQAEEDAKDTFLDGKLAGFKADGQNITGIWYSVEPLRIGTNLFNKFYAKKFLIVFDEASQKTTLYSKYGFETKVREKTVLPAVWQYEDERHYRTSIREGHFSTGNPGVDARMTEYYAYTSFAGSYDTQSNPIKGEAEFQNFGELIEMEKGILVAFENKYYNRTMEKNDLVYAQMEQGFIFYKPEKEARAKQITQEDIHNFFKDYRKRWEKAHDAGDNGVRLPKAGNANKAPIFAKYKTDALKTFNEWKKNYPEYAQYTPIYAFTLFERPEFAPVVSYREGVGKVPTARNLDLYIVCFNTKQVKEDGNAKRGYNTDLKNKYVYFFAATWEDMKDGKHSIQEYSGKQYIQNVAGPIAIAETEDAMENK